MLKIIGIIVAACIIYLLVRKMQEPKSKTERLAITIWASFGPYSNAEDAETSLNRAIRAVFGKNGMTEHKDWFENHVKNFRDWQAEDRFENAQNLMLSGLALTSHGTAFREAFRAYKMEALEDAQGMLDGLSKGMPEIQCVVQQSINHHRELLEKNNNKEDSR